MIRAALVAIAAALPAVVASAASAQTLSTGVIVGAVTNESGAPLNSVTITITNRANGQRTLARTDRAGAYGSELLAPGHYDALFEILGFRPHRVEDILVVAGASRDVRISLDPLTPSDSTISVSPAPPSQSHGGSAGPDRWLVGQPVASLPFEGNGLAAILATSSIAGERHEIEGLPATHSTFVIDGVPFVRRPRGFDVFAMERAIPQYALTQTGLIANNPDVEYPGSSATIMAHTRRGGRDRGLSGFGDYGSDATASGTGQPPAFTSYRAGMIAEGPVVRDTASFIVGGEVLRARSAFESFWTDDPSPTPIVNAAASVFQSDLARYAEPTLETIDRESAYGRLDMRFSESTSINAYGIYSTMNQPEPVAPWTERPVASTLTPRLRNILAGASFVSRIDDDLMTQIDAGFESSRSLERLQDDRGQALPLTTIVDAGRQFGSQRSQEYLGEILAFFFRGTLHFRSGSHWRKLGMSAELPSYKVPADIARNGTFTYASTADYRNGFGYYRGIEAGTRNRADFSTRRISIIGQDMWRPSPSVQLLVGARISSFRLPDSSDVTPSPGWINLANQSNRRFPGRVIEFEPRFSITVSPASRPNLQLRGGIMVDANVADPSIVGEILSNNGTLNVRSGLGSVPGWPMVPSSQAITLRDPTLTVLGPNFRGPRTTRAFGSLSNAFGPVGALTIGFTHRRTEFLPQRIDLNRLPGVAARDQYGRPLYGMVSKRGGMIVAENDTNRRFNSFEEVWGLQATGESTYTGVTLTAERSLAGPVGFFASYTWSKTEDDWLIGSQGDPFTQLAPFDSIGPEDWTTGVSDLDVPNRVVAGLEVALPGSFAPRLAALYRYQSGYPFTPGFRPGVDVNADGSGSNDPAFIDPSVAGMSGLLDAWPCLEENANQFVARNACRAPAVRGLDARFSLTFQQDNGYTASLVVDGLNLIASEAGEIDRAVYLIDPDRSIGFPTAGSVDIPLIVNPDFGKMLTRYEAQRMLRVGVRVTF